MHQFKKRSSLIFVAAFVLAVSAKATTVDWQGGTDNWSAAKWSIDGGPATRTYGTTISNQVTITAGIVTTSGDLVAAVGGTVSNQNLTVSGDAQLDIGGMIDFGPGNGNTQTLGFTMTNTAQVTATYLNLKTKNLDRSDVVFAGGTLVLTDSNSIRGGNFPNQNVDITSGVGGFSIIANSTEAGKTLATKVGSDLFSIDGNEIVVVADGNDVAALNTELASIVVNGKSLQISEGAGTQTLNIVAGSLPADASLVLNPESQLDMLLFSPNTTATGIVEVGFNYGENLNDVVITSVAFSNESHAVGSFTTPGFFSLTLTDPLPSNETLNIEFDNDIAGLSNDEVASAIILVEWTEETTGVTNITQLPVQSHYVELAPSTGNISFYGVSFPSSNVVFGTTGLPAAETVTKLVSRRAAVGYAKFGQEITAGALTNGPAIFDGVIVRTGNAVYDLSAASGANQLQIWFGTIDETTGATNKTYATETFDCSGISFAKFRWYQFELGSAVTFDPSSLAANESFAFQLWWTSNDPDNVIGFSASDAIDLVDGATHHETPAIGDTTFPVTMDNRFDNRDIMFALMNSSGTIPDLGEVSLAFDGANLIMSWEGLSGVSYAVQRRGSLVSGSWSNVVEGLMGSGTISVTNDTTDPQAFYRTIKQ